MAITGRVRTANGLLNKWPLGPSSLMGRTLDENFEAIDAFMNSGVLDPLFSVGSNGIVKAPTQDDVDNNRILKAANGGGAWVADAVAVVFSQGVAGIVNGPTADDISNGRIVNASNAWINVPAAPANFSQGVAGLVSGPTADDISNGRIVNASNAWIDAPSGGLNKSGTITEPGAGANAGGLNSGVGVVAAAGAATLVIGHTDGLTGSTVRSHINAEATLVFGRVTDGGLVEADDATMGAVVFGWADDAGSRVAVDATNYGQGPAFVLGHAQNGATVIVDGLCAVAFARASSSGSSVRSRGGASMVVGNASGGGSMDASSTGCTIFGRCNQGSMSNQGIGSILSGNVNNTGDTMTILEAGSILVGDCIGFDNVATMRCGLGGNQAAGSQVFGYAIHTDGIPVIETLATAAQARGFANNASITASGQASFATANADNTADCVASGAGAWQIGIGTVAVENAFQLGAGILHVEHDSVSPKIGLFAATPVTQRAHLADPADEAALVIWAAALNVQREEYGLCAAA